MVGGALDDASGKRQSLLGDHGDPGLVVRHADHGGAVLLDQRQDPLHAVFFSRDGVDQRLALIGGQSRLQRFDDRGVDADRNVGHLHHRLDGRHE